jgi:hypothetical protein
LLASRPEIGGSGWTGKVGGKIGGKTGGKADGRSRASRQALISKTQAAHSQKRKGRNTSASTLFYLLI